MRTLSPLALVGFVLGLSGLGQVFGQDSSGGGLKENLDLPFDAIGDNDDDEELPEVVNFYGLNLEGDGFFYVIDRSGSMQDSGELGVAKREVTKNIQEFSDRVQFGIVFFAKDVNQFPQGGQPAEANPGMKSSAISWLQAQTGSSGSCCMAGFTAVLKLASQSTAKRKVVVYLGDGGGTCSGEDESAYLAKTQSAINAQNFLRIQINTIGVLQIPEINEKFLKTVAASNGGTYSRVTR